MITKKVKKADPYRANLTFQFYNLIDFTPYQARLTFPHHYLLKELKDK
jgi:hypothetical protein